MSADVLLVPGFGGSEKQALLGKISAELSARGKTSAVIVMPKRRPDPSLGLEVEVLRAAWRERSGGRAAIVGRSFGGRVAVRLAGLEPVPALVLLGFPVRPPGKRRPLDEAALVALTCPTLILQGEDDELGPPEVLAALVASRPHITLEVVAGAKHAYGRKDGEVAARAAEWLLGHLQPV